MTDLEKYGITVSPALVDLGQTVYRAEVVSHVPAVENDGRHCIYVDVYRRQKPAATVGDEEFEEVQVVGHRVIRWWSGEDGVVPLPEHHDIVRTWDEKPEEEPGANFPMYSATRYAVTLLDCAADVVSGLHSWHPDEGDGATFGHHSFYIKYVGQVAGLPEGDGMDDGADEGETLEEYVRRKTWDAVGVDYNPESAFCKYATAHDLGKPESQEFDLEHDGETYRAQAFTKGIVFARVGEWDHIWFVPW